MAKGKKKIKILYETTFHGKKLMVAADKHNWIILVGEENLKEWVSNAERWFFTSLPNMLLALQKHFIKNRIKRLETSEMIRVVEKSYDDVKELGQGLALEIAGKGRYKDLPRFPCDHVLGPYPKALKRYTGAKSEV